MKSNSVPPLFIFKKLGEGGIRTLGLTYKTYALARRSLKPLGHHSCFSCARVATLEKAREGQRIWLRLDLNECHTAYETVILTSELHSL